MKKLVYVRKGRQWVKKMGRGAFNGSWRVVYVLYYAYEGVHSHMELLMGDGTHIANYASSEVISPKEFRQRKLSLGIPG